MNLPPIWTAVWIIGVVIPPIQIIAVEVPQPWNQNDRCGWQQERTSDGFRHKIQPAATCQCEQRTKRKNVKEITNHQVEEPPLHAPRESGRLSHQRVVGGENIHACDAPAPKAVRLVALFCGALSKNRLPGKCESLLRVSNASFTRDLSFPTRTKQACEKYATP